jgi:hypothetical protein
LGAADPLLQLGGGTATGSALPDVHIVDATIHLITPQGAFDATGDADVSQADAGAPIAIELPALHLRELASPARFEPANTWSSQVGWCRVRATTASHKELP